MLGTWENDYSVIISLSLFITAFGCGQWLTSTDYTTIKKKKKSSSTVLQSTLYSLH